MTARGQAFDPDNDHHVALWDELPLWSALAGQMLLEHVPLEASRVLDLGCGTGFPLLEIAERLGPSSRAVGLDVWDAALHRANAKRATWPVTNAHLVRGDGARMPFRSGSFGLVISNLGINNFADPETSLAECRRVLISRGSLALSSNLVGHFRELYDVFEDVLKRGGGADSLQRLRKHIAHRASLEALTRLLTRYGFRIESAHEKTVPMRMRDGSAVFAHHFMRLGFVPAWIEVAGKDAADEILAALRGALDARSRTGGELKLSVPIAVIVARAI